MNKRERNQKIAKETLEIIKNGSYQSNKIISIKEDLNNSIQQSILYKPKQTDEILLNLKLNNNHKTIIEIKNESTLSAAKRLKDESYENVVCLNFASAKNPGGGWLKGSMAQEESLVISSGLYPCITQMEEMYNYNKQIKTGLYSDYMIYSPDVVVFRDDKFNLLDDFYKVSFITAPAVNAGLVMEREPHNKKLINTTMEKRIEKILALGLLHKNDAIVLGAFGCGVFKNSPYVVANIFKKLLNQKFRNQYKKVVFAIVDRSKNEELIKVFKNTFNIR